MPTVSTSSGTDGSNPAPSSGESIANSTSVTGPTGGLMRSAAGAPVRKLLFVEALGHARVPFAGDRPDHRAGIELAAIDAHRAAEAAADLERRFDDGVAREARQDRFEIGDFAGQAAARHSVPPRSV